MKKFLLASLISLIGFFDVKGELQQFDGPLYGISVDSVTYECGILDAEAKTVCLKFDFLNCSPTDIKIPAYVTLNDPAPVGVYEVVQLNSYSAKLPSTVKSIEIPGTMLAIAKGAISGNYMNRRASIIINKGEKPLEIYDSFILTDHLSINKAIKNCALSSNVFVNSDSIVVKIGPDVSSIEGDFFDNLAIKEAQFENWNNWYYNTKIDGFSANPYANGAKITAGGFTITTVDFEEGITEIPDYKNCGLKFEGELLLPSTLKRIGAYAFQNQKNLFYVDFSEGLEEIADYAFDGCDGLTFDGFPESLKTIGNSAFQGCKAQKSIILPENLTNLGNAAFQYMTGLEKAILFSQVDFIPEKLCYGCTNLSSLYLPKGAKYIGDEAFAYDYKLEELILPESLESIGKKAFCCGVSWDRGSLSKIKFPKSLKTIGDYAFAFQGMRSLDLNEGLEVIGSHSFANNENLTYVTFPSTLKTIGDFAFSFTNLIKINLPASVTQLGKCALSEEGSVVVLGDGLTDIPDGALGAPTVLTVGKNVKTFASGALEFTNIRVMEMLPKTPPTVDYAFFLDNVDVDNITFLVPDGTKDAYKRNPRWAVFNIVEESEADITVYVNGSPITEEARLQSGLHPSQIVRMTVTGTLDYSDWRLIRENFASLISLDLSGITNTYIGDNALQNMEVLTNLVLPSKLKKIGVQAFFSNSLMDVPSLPETIEEIGAAAFAWCKMLSISKLPDALKLMSGSSHFIGCTSLRSITAGPLLNIEGDSNFEGCVSLEYVDFGDTQIKELGEKAFYGCSSLANIVLPSQLENIGSYTFQNTALEYIQLPSTIKTIGKYALSNTNLRTVTIPAGVEQIPDNLFNSCKKLVSVNFPSTVTDIGAYLFSDTEKVTGISSLAVYAPSAATDALSALSIRRCGLSIPQQSYKSYLNAAQWGRLANMTNRLVVEMPEENFNVTAIDEVEYIDISSQEKWQQEAEEAAEGEEPAAVQARRAAKASLTSGDAYTQLFNDAQFATPTTEKGTRIFINPINGATLKSVFLGDEDVTSQMEGNSLLLPVKAVGTIRIVADLTGSGIEEIAFDDVIAFDTVITAFDTMGREVFAGRRADLDAAVAPGLYIIKSATTTAKVLVK